jgi:hypothetical protein
MVGIEDAATEDVVLLLEVVDFCVLVTLNHFFGFHGGRS